ncbi:ParA family protein [Uliginosibacterium sp. H1]|uniref:ParA family protein n=1 Tax=Uliginosibacterium sp. H1 TaxID=3114757 RepID=UPI002E175EA1|nr:ParA family protein [Uliginosibacterium sp. H1]
MAVFAVVNRKGGVGKSTVATHVAAYLASKGLEVMLGDVDRQQSSRLWLSLRPESRPHIHGWTIDDRNFARPPAGVKHVVLDTPGGFQGIGLMKVAQYADAIIVPATTSVFDRAAAADSIKELRSFPRIATGKCTLACLGMRIDGRTRNGEALQRWAAGLELNYLGSIKAAQAYSRCLEQGLALFDYPHEKVADYLREWTALVALLDATLAREAEPAPAARTVETDERIRPVVASVPDYLRR